VRLSEAPALGLDEDAAPDQERWSDDASSLVAGLADEPPGGNGCAPSKTACKNTPDSWHDRASAWRGGLVRALVTGCAGFIGSHLTDRLLADGHTVVGIDSFRDYYARAYKDANLEQARLQAGFELHEADLLELAAQGEAPGSLRALLRGIDCVYHLAAQAGVRASWGSSFDTYTRDNVLATQQLLEACVAAEVAKVIYASSSSVYGDQDVLPLVETARCVPRSPYGVTKLAAEHLCGLYHDNHGLDTTALRLFTVYGPRQRPDMAFHIFICALLEGRDIVLYGDGSQTRDFTYVADIVAGLIEARKAPPGLVANLGGGHRVSLLAGLETLSQLMRVPLRLDVRHVAAGDVKDTWADISVARRTLGYEPKHGLSDGLEQEVAWVECTESQRLSSRWAQSAT